ncbi:MAG: hypothetical protein ACYS0G_07615 [Planctomycetota bacterium]|jgi:uncharacterized membrane protein YphA (DoxX/SURF4 family)
MDPVVRIRGFGAQQRDRVLRGYRWAAAPSGAGRLALVALAVLVGLPILLVIGVAVLAAALVFGILALGYLAFWKLRRLLPARDGRSNVRVIRRPDE